jgi:hypothetical protein
MMPEHALGGGPVVNLPVEWRSLPSVTAVGSNTPPGGMPFVSLPVREEATLSPARRGLLSADSLTRLLSGGTQSAHASDLNPVAAIAAESSKKRALVRLLDTWLMDESGYDVSAWPEIRRGLERDRLSNRRLFPEQDSRS